MRVFFSGGGTGGHLYPGLAIARALVERVPTVQPLFIGAQRGIEQHVLPGTEFPHLLLPLHPLYRSAPWRNVQTVTGFIAALRAIDREASHALPALVVGTGGYAAGAALAWARLRGVRTVVHDCDAFPGKVTRWAAPRAALVSVGFPEAAARLAPVARAHTISVGNPIAPPPESAHARAAMRAATRAQYGVEAHERLVLVVGGSQGSVAINEAVAAWCAQGIPPNVHVVWATGRAHAARYAPLAAARVHVTPYLAPIANAYAAADVAIARAGAMSLAELAAWGVPAVLIPLPTAAHDHQTHNARCMEDVGAARHLPQSALSGASLAHAVASLLDDERQRQRMVTCALARSTPNAAARLADVIAQLLPAATVGARADALSDAHVGAHADRHDDAHAEERS